MSDLVPHDAPDVDPDVARRLTAAFGALARAEVPASAPRPAAAPRPVVRSSGPSPRRRWGIAGGSLLVAAAAVVLALVLGTEVFDARVATTAPPATVVSTPPPATTPPATTSAPVTPSTAASSPPPATTTPPSTPASTGPGAAAVAAAFAGVSNGTRSTVVTVPGGYEGADLTGATVIRLWTSTDGTTWRQAGTSSYPPVVTGSSATAYIKAAGLPTGAPNAVFVVSDQYATGDSTGVDVAFGGGPDGFGAIKGAADGDLHLSGQGVTAVGDIGGSYRSDLQGGLLVTVDCTPDSAGTLCDSTVTKTWRWSGGVFVLVNSA